MIKAADCLESLAGSQPQAEGLNAGAGPNAGASETVLNRYASDQRCTMQKFLSACFTVGLALILPLPAAGQSYVFTRILDSTTLRPDGEPFGISFSPTTPSFDGKWVVFRDPGPQNDGGSHALIWSYNTQDGTFHKLVDLTTPVPGSTATFANLLLVKTAPVLRNGTVIFIALDTSGPGAFGLYSVPAAGGPIVKVADSSTADPSGGKFTVFDYDSNDKQVGAFAFDGTTVAFSANGSASTLGAYTAKPDGSALALIADSLHTFTAPGGRVGTFQVPAISGNNVVMIGTDGTTPIGTGYNGIYLAKLGGNGAVTELLNSTQPLPGNPNAAFHTRFNAPVLAFDGNLVAFRADDSKSSFFGLYTTDLTSHAINKIADVNSTLPGLGQLADIAHSGVAVNQGGVLFKAADTAGKSALYLWKSGVIARVVGTGDTPGSVPLQGITTDPGPAALNGSSFVFNANFGTSRGLYLATASPTTTSVSAASYALPPVAPNMLVSAFGQNLALGTFAAQGTLPTTLGDITVKVKDNSGVERLAPLVFVSPSQINYMVPDGTPAGPVALSVLRGTQAIASESFAVAPVAPGIFTANMDGAGVATAYTIKVGADGTQTLQLTFQCGTAAGSCVNTPIDLGTLSQPVYLVLFGTGIRGTTPPPAVTAKIGGIDATVTYSGPQNQFAGLDQVNVLIPAGLAGKGEVDVVLTADGKASNAVKVNFK